MPGVSMSTKNAVMPRGSAFPRAGAGEQDAAGGVLGEARPHLLAVDHPVVAPLLGAGGQRREVAAGAGFGEALAPLLAARQQPRHHLGGQFRTRVVDHRRGQHLEHRVRPGLGQAAADDLLADDGPQDRGPAEPARRLGPAVAHPARVVQRAQHPGELRADARPASGRGRRRQVVLVEPGSADPARNSAVLADVGSRSHPASGLPIACGRPESCSPLRRMNVMARVLSRQPSSVRT